MVENIPTTNYYSYDYNPRKKVRKAGIIGATVGLVAGAGLQYGGGELLYKVLEKNPAWFAGKYAKAVANNKKGLVSFYDYLIEAAAKTKLPFSKWKGIGVAGLIGATIVGLASALSAAKKQLP